MNEEEILYNQLYEKTKDFGRTQFIKELMRLEKENKQLKERIDKATEKIKSNISILNESIESKDKTDRIATLAYAGIRAIFRGIENTLKGESNE